MSHGRGVRLADPSATFPISSACASPPVLPPCPLRCSSVCLSCTSHLSVTANTVQDHQTGSPRSFRRNDLQLTAGGSGSGSTGGCGDCPGATSGTSSGRSGSSGTSGTPGSGTTGSGSSVGTGAPGSGSMGVGSGSVGNSVIHRRYPRQPEANRARAARQGPTGRDERRRSARRRGPAVQWRSRTAQSRPPRCRRVPNR